MDEWTVRVVGWTKVVVLLCGEGEEEMKGKESKDA